MAENIKELPQIISAPKIIPRKKRKKGLNFNPLDSVSSNDANLSIERDKKINKKEKKLKIKAIKTEIQEEKIHKTKRINKRESGNKNNENISPEEIVGEVKKVEILEESEERLKKVEQKIEEEDEMFGKWMQFAEEESNDNPDDSTSEREVEDTQVLEKPIDFESEDEALDEIEDNFEELKKILPEEFITEVQTVDRDHSSSSDLSEDEKTESIKASTEEYKPSEDNEAGSDTIKNIVEDDGELTYEWVKFLAENEENGNKEDKTETPDDTNSNKIRKNDEESYEGKNVEMQNDESLQNQGHKDQSNTGENIDSETKGELIQDEDNQVNEAEDIKTQNIESLLNKKISEQSEIISELKKEIELLKQKQRPEKELTEKEKRQKQFEDKLQQGQKLGFFGGGSSVEIHDYSNPSKIKIEKIFDDSKQNYKSKPISLLKLLLIFLGLVFVIILMLIIFFCFTQEVQPDCGCIEIKQLVEKIF